MKDIIITTRRLKTEIITWAVCFIIVNLANLYAIIEYNTQFIELLTSLGYVAVASIVLYLLWSLLRIIFYGLRRLFIKRKPDIN